MSREHFLSPISPLNPVTTLDILPAPNADDLRCIKRAGYRRYGIVAAVMCEDRLMLLRHVPSDKTKGNQWGPLGETAKMTLQEDGAPDYIETTAETLARGLHEEVGVEPEKLSLTARAIGAWALHSWPIGHGYGRETALATCPVIRINQMQGEAIERDFQPTNEIDDMAFLAPHEIFKLRQKRHFRAGTTDWLRAIATCDLRSEAQFLPLQLPEPPELPGAVDIDFDNERILL